MTTWFVRQVVSTIIALWDDSTYLWDDSVADWDSRPGGDWFTANNTDWETPN